jgi:hypothetical protein
MVSGGEKDHGKVIHLNSKLRLKRNSKVAELPNYMVSWRDLGLLGIDVATGPAKSPARL